MKCKRNILLPIVLLCLLAPMVSASVIGGPKYDDFAVTLEGDNSLIGGTGTGWNNGEWIYYSQTDWWNQWFYDDPPSWDRMKHIEYQFDINPLVDDAFVTDIQITVEVALNWSTMEYPFTGMDGQPPMPDEEWAIGREVVLTAIFEDPAGLHVDGIYDILDFNPEWVSIDVRAYAWGYSTGPDLDNGIAPPDMVPLQVDIIGEIMHECIIPEPATLLLLGFGGLAVMKKVRA